MYPEYSFVFCGDDGQGDLLAGEMMMNPALSENNNNSASKSVNVKAVFIHRVIKVRERTSGND